jgi:hypothetical protein
MAFFLFQEVKKKVDKEKVQPPKRRAHEVLEKCRVPSEQSTFKLFRAERIKHVSRNFV